MPTFTAISFDTLIEPGGTSRSSSKTVNGSNPVLNSQLQRRNSSPAAPTKTTSATTERKYHRAQISPSLYATPEVTPLPDTPCSFPPSPYIINHKRRGPRLLKSLYEEDVSSCKKPRDKEKVIETLTHAEAKLISVPQNGDGAANDVFSLNLVGAKHGNSVLSEEVGSSGVRIGVAKENKTTRSISSYSDEESDIFYDQLGSGSVRTDTDGEDNGATDNSFKLSTSTVFYDAWEELSSDGASQSSFVRDVDDEIREMRLSLLMEIEKRKQAEESLVSIRTQWQRIREQLSLAGLTLPADITVEASEQIAEDLCQQLYLVRFVADSVGRGIAKAEMESQVEAKNVEIARLTDRLHYCEAVNQEMSQRNQEAVEVARRDWQRRKTRQKWIWGSIAAAITFGTAALVWPFNQPGTSSLSSSDHAGDPEHHDSAE